MSRPKERWWSYVRNILHAYPAMRSSPDRDRMEQRECAAVAQALEESDPVTRELVRLVFFDRSHTLEGAAALHGISYADARRMQGDFLRLVWKYLDVLHLGTADQRPEGGAAPHG